VLPAEQCVEMSAGTGRFSGDAEMAVDMMHWRRSLEVCSRWRKRQPRRLGCQQCLKWGRVVLVGHPAPFDLPGLHQVSCLLSCSSNSHKIPLRIHQNSPFSDKKKILRRGTGPRIAAFAGENRLRFGPLKHWLPIVESLTNGTSG